MTQNQQVVIEIANTKLQVPLVVDAETTRAIAAQVNARFAEYEAQTGRIDTQRFALLTAFAFAAEAHLSTQQEAEDERAILSALEALHESLQKTIGRLQDVDLF